MTSGRGPAAPGGPWLALDTATSHAAVALGEGTRLLAGRTWAAGRQHGETLLAAIDELLRQQDLTPRDLRAVIVGTGPGAFTGLRVGMATAKTLAHELRLAIAGVPTAVALAVAATAGAAAVERPLTVVVVQPAGPHDRYVTAVDLQPGLGSTTSTPRLVPRGEPLGLEDADGIVAVDLAADAAAGLTDLMVERGRAALDGLAAALLVAGGAVFTAAGGDDAAALVPLYVSLPRGVTAGGMAWSPDLR